MKKSKDSGKDAVIEAAPDEFDLPPAGFLYFLIAQGCDDKLPLARLEEKVAEYIRRKPLREQRVIVPSMTTFLGRVASTANYLSPHVRIMEAR